VRLAFDEAGVGDCVVLIHGHPFDRTLWQPRLASLRDRFRVPVPDLRGFGAGHPPNLEAEAEFNQALRAFLLSNAPGRFTQPLEVS
jgi:hypothetical protein